MDFRETLFDSSKMLADYVVNKINRDEVLFKSLFEFVLENHPRYSARAAGILYKLDDKYPDLIIPYLDQLVHNLSIPSTSILRAFLRILSRHVGQLNETQFGIVLNTSFNILMEPTSEAAHKAYSMYILFDMYKIEPQIKEELKASIEANLEYCSKGVKGLGRKILRQIGGIS